MLTLLFLCTRIIKSHIKLTFLHLCSISFRDFMDANSGVCNCNEYFIPMKSCCYYMDIECSL